MSKFPISVLSAMICAVLAVPQTAPAALVLNFSVNIVEDGPVTVGDTINWEIYTTVSGTAEIGDNFGIAGASVNLQDSFGDMLTTGDVQNDIGEDFQGYALSDGGDWNPLTEQLENVTVFQNNPNAGTRGATGDLGPHLLATGSYTVTTAGLHTLSTVMSSATSRYWSDNEMPLATETPYNQIVPGSDTIMVQAAAVPEPASLAMMGLAACGALGLRRRRRGSQVEQVT